MTREEFEDAMLEEFQKGRVAGYDYAQKTKNTEGKYTIFTK